MLTVEEFIKLSDAYNQRVNESSKVLNDICKGHESSNGLVDEQCRNSPEYKSATANFKHNFAILRAFNSTIPKDIQRQMAIERRQKGLNKN